MCRSRSYLCGLLALVLLAGACSPGSETSGQEESAEGPRRGGTMVVALSAEPPHLNRNITTDIAVGMAALPMMESLVSATRDFDVAPVLAESWDISEDGLEYTFHLREGVEWHDGEAFTSADVKFSFDEVLPLNPTGSQLRPYLQKVEAPDDLTVVVTLNEPYAAFLLGLSPQNFTILPRHIYEGTDILDNEANLEPIGTGPFKLDEWKRGESIEFVRNDDYWDAPKPYLDRLVFTVIPDPNSRVTALTTGSLDFIVGYDLPLNQVKGLEAEQDVVLEEGRTPVNVLLLHYNLEREPFDDPRVRKALFMAIDRELLVNSAFQALATPGKSSFPPAIEWAYNPDVDYTSMYPHDPEAAAAMLDEAGLTPGPDGVRFEVEFKYSTALPGADATADVLRSSWRDIGVRVKLASREATVWQEQSYVQRDYDVTTTVLDVRADPVLGIQRAYICEDDPKAVYTNPTSYCNPQLDELMSKAASTIDQGDRAPFYYEAQEIIAEDLPTAVLADLPGFDAISASFGEREEAFANAVGTVEVKWEELYLME